MKTPWGSPDQLRSRRLPPGPGKRPDVVARNQRERLLGAMVAAVATHGYEATRVADLLDLCGVSRSAFYRHFANKHECFMATLDAILETTVETLCSASHPQAQWDRRLGDGLAVLLKLIADQPAAARLVLVEVYAAGPDAVERFETAAELARQAVSKSLTEAAGGKRLTAQMVRAIVGGIARTISSRLAADRAPRFDGLSDDLLEWIRSYVATELPREIAAAASSPAPAAWRERDDVEQRLMKGVAATIAKRGWADSTIVEMAKRSSVSLTTFYEHYAGKEEAFNAALDHWARAASDATRREGVPSDGWPHELAASLAALFDFLASDPVAARIVAVEAYAAGKRSRDIADSILSVRRLAGPDWPRARDTVWEAIDGGVAALVADQVRRDARKLTRLGPTASQFALAPLIAGQAPSDAPARA